MLTLISVSIAGCATTDGCTRFKPMRPSANDAKVISDGFKRQIVAHNETGEEHCGWKP